MASNRQSYSQLAAKSLVERVAKDHGYLGEAVYARIDPETRRKVQEALLTKDRKIGSSVMLLARELYSRDVQFVFELLQNADDNHYSNASAPPYVAFHLYKRTVIIECNEDGFNETNLRAICDIGKSSKVHSHGYIGEKGIGFKSVFKVAWKVHIQSGDFSFAFVHHPGDSGMGMISPEWEDCSEETTNSLTRITLYLLNDNEAVERRKSIEKQLKELNGNMLLFLKNLQRIEVHIYDDMDEEVSSTIMTAAINKITNRAVLQRHCTQNGISEETKTYCHVTKHQATGLAKSSNRTYTAAEETANSYGKSEVILAFPLSENSTPIIEAQQLFAFLPLRRLGFNFLIQADFVTMANRESIVTSSLRNLALLDGIAEAFIKAMHQMYDHDTLRYQWMRYLSHMKTYPWDDPFWKRLVDKIEAKVRSAELLQPRRRGSPRLIRYLRRLTPGMHDESGNPLFKDLPEISEKYISMGYQNRDLDILKDYGLQYLFHDELIQRVGHDLRQPNPWMKNPATTDDWHTRSATIINYSFSRNWVESITETRLLNLLPLCDGNWVSASHQTFIPKTEDGVTVPSDLDLRMLALSACENAARAMLFKNLGAKHVDPANVVGLIHYKYTVSSTDDSISLEASHSHLVFLFHYHRNVNSLLSDCIKLYDTEDRLLLPSATDCYFTSEEPYSLWHLSEQGQDKQFDSYASFIHPRYLHCLPEGRSDLSWKGWLSLLGVRDQPRLINRNGSSLSPLCLHIAESLPPKFLEFLRCAWESNEEELLLNEGIVKALKSVEVLCLSDGEAALQRLSRTYLPLPSLQERCSDFMGDDFFPFLDLGESWSSDEEGKWRFLTKHLGVGTDDNLEFYVDMVYWMQDSSEGEQIESPSRILDVYKRIHAKCMEARDQSAAREFVRGKLRNQIYVPQYDDEEGKWADASNCVCNAPPDHQYKIPIMARYESAFPGANLNLLEEFFRDTLGISQCSWMDVIQDLEILQLQETSDFDRIRSRYEYLNQARGDWVTVELNTDAMRTDFESKSLIFIQNQQGQYKWVKPSECLWHGSTATEIQHKVSLNNHYDDDLEDFFVKVLGVSRLTINMVYDELYGVDPSTATVKQVKDSLRSLSAFLATEKPMQSSKKLLGKSILPIRYPDGDVRLVAANTDFAIVDRRPLEIMFRDKVKLLDFSLSEVHDLEPLLDWLNLTDRYLSNLTSEITVVDLKMVFSLSDPTRLIKKKAHALTRVAVHLKSPHTRDPDAIKDFYALLLASETWETDGISSILAMNQDGDRVPSGMKRSEVHIAASENPLKIYVPHDEVQQEVCFGSALPEQIVRWMVTEPITQHSEPKIDQSAIKVVTGILGAKSAVAMDRILDMQGFIGIDIPNIALEDTNQPSNASIEPDTLQDQLQHTFDSSERLASHSTPASANSEANRYYASDARFRPQQSPDAHQPDAFRTQSTTRSYVHYRSLLEHVVACGRATSFPRRGTNSFSTYADRHLLRLPSGNGDSEWLLRECDSTFERDLKIGAAGELFAFELLGSLLEDFGRACWQSTIRRHVAGATGHPDYVDMEPWSSSGAWETSDIVYKDVSGVLTQKLVEGQYLDVGQWAGQRGVQYYIEVKSTFRECNEPFYASDRQRKLMRELMTDDSVYMILRVFNMTSSSIGAKIYVDPSKMEEEGLLKFVTDKWTVTPGVTDQVR